MPAELSGSSGQLELANAETTPVQEATGQFIAHLDSTANSQINALSRQNDIRNILSNETQRLSDKKVAIDNAMKAQGRIIYFNDNSRKWYAAYLKIILILVVILAIIFALKLLSDNYSTIIPFWILQLLFIITICVGFIVIFGVYAETARHSRYNYDELKMTSPDVEIIDPSTNQTRSPFDMGALSGQFCVDDSCCAEGTTWNEDQGKCIPTVASTSTTAPSTTAPRQQGFTTLNRISPTDAFEYAEYAPYK